MLKGEGKFPSGLDKPLKTCIFNRTAGLLTKQIYDRLTPPPPKKPPKTKTQQKTVL